MKSGYVYVEGREDPVTTSQLAAETGIERQVITNRAARVANKRYYEGKWCGVLSKHNLKPPINRSSKGQYLKVRLTPEDRQVLNDVLNDSKSSARVEQTLRKLKRALKLNNGTQRGIKSWDDRVKAQYLSARAKHA